MPERAALRRAGADEEVRGISSRARGAELLAHYEARPAKGEITLLIRGQRAADFPLARAPQSCELSRSPNPMAFAIIKTGGSQHRVSEGDIMDVDFLDAEVGKEGVFADVLLTGMAKISPTADR